MGVGYDINSLYPHMVSGSKQVERWVMAFSWKRRVSYTTGDKIWLEYAYKKIGSDQWLSQVDYIIYQLKND